jgi:NAD(P)-dependent dehydrogenase (short-subunit alcohol dehydrogenase family)
MTRTALVTGANQGIGFAIVAELADRLDPEDLILLTGRDPARVAAAAAAVEGKARVEGRVLDVTDTAAVAELAKELGPTDIVISNAIGPLTPGRPQTEEIDNFVAVANGGTHAVLRSFAPTLPDGGRLLVIASSLGTLGQLPPHLHDVFENKTLDEVAAVVEEWRRSVHNGTAAARGWPEWVNIPSKVAQVAAVRAVTRPRRDRDLAYGTLIAAVCPGLVDTRASRPWFADFSRALTPAQSAKPIVDLVLGPLNPSTYGELVRFGAVLPWHSATLVS